MELRSKLGAERPPTSLAPARSSRARAAITPRPRRRRPPRRRERHPPAAGGRGGRAGRTRGSLALDQGASPMPRESRARRSEFVNRSFLWNPDPSPSATSAQAKMCGWGRDEPVKVLRTPVSTPRLNKTPPSPGQKYLKLGSRFPTGARDRDRRKRGGRDLDSGTPKTKTNMLDSEGTYQNRLGDMLGFFILGTTQGKKSISLIPRFSNT